MAVHHLGTRTVALIVWVAVDLAIQPVPVNNYD